MLLVSTFLLAAAPAFAASPDVPIRTLGEAYAAALAASEEVAVSEQSIRRAEALYKEALGDSLPGLSYRSQTAVEDNTNRRTETDGALRLSHAGLNGYRELASLRGAKADAAAARIRRRLAEQLLLSDLAAAFYGLLQARDDAANISELQKLAERRMKELQERVRVGRSREADALAQEFQAASLAAQFEESSRQAAARADLLGYLTRRPSLDPIVPSSAPPAALAPLESYLARLESRPDVGSARADAESAEQSVKAAFGDRLPDLAFTANRYTNRPARRERVKWDAGLTLSLPLFAWGGARASVDAARASSESAALELRSVRRQAELEVRDAYRDLGSARRQLEVRRRALILADKDYGLQRRDEERGLVTSLEILESLNRLSSARLALTQADLAARLAAVALDLAAGARPEEMDLR